MGTNSGFDAIVFGEVVFPEGGVMAWVSEVYHRIAQLERFDVEADEELAQILVTPAGVAVRCWLFASSFQEWCPRLEAMFSQAARQGGRGDIVFLGVGDGPAYRLLVEHGRANLQRIPVMGFEHPTVQEIALAVELKSERRKAAAIAAATSVTSRSPTPPGDSRP